MSARVIEKVTVEIIPDFRMDQSTVTFGLFDGIELLQSCSLGVNHDVNSRTDIDLDSLIIIKNFLERSIDFIKMKEKLRKKNEPQRHTPKL